MASDRSYTPHQASFEAWRTVVGGLGISHGVLVQPSFYGEDNRLLLQTLAEARGELVGVAAVAHDVGNETLQTLANAGVRGVRLAHFAPESPRALNGFVPLGSPAQFVQLTRRLADHGMHVQLLTDSRLLPAIESMLRDCPVPVVLDHMGRAPAELGVLHEGMTTLTRLLAAGKVWVKLSGIANISNRAPAYEDAALVHKRLIEANPEQLLWGSDWPHTRTRGPTPVTAALWECFNVWTPDPAMRARILSINPRRLYRFELSQNATLETTRAVSASAGQSLHRPRLAAK